MPDEANDWGHLGSAADEREHRARALSDPGAYHGDIAARELHWFDGREWVTLSEDGEWRGALSASEERGKRGKNAENNRGERIAFNLPNIPEQIFYTQAAKRLGLIYTPVFGGFSAKTLSDRIHDAGARVLVTADGGYRNAEIIAYKETYTDPALDNYIPRRAALRRLSSVLARFDLGAARAGLESRVGAALAGEITLERADVMRELGRALAEAPALAPALCAQLRTALARELAGVQHDVEHVIVVRHTGQDIIEQPRDRWSHELLAASADRVLARATHNGFAVSGAGALESLSDRELWRALNSVRPAEPVDAEWPLFIIYTSGSTGKPKGVVHTHGGWLAGIAHSMRTVFAAQGDDLQSRLDLPQSGDERPGERARPVRLRPAQPESGHVLRRTGVVGRAAVRHAAPLRALHQFLLGHGTRRHGVLLPLGRFQGPASRHQDLAPAVD